MRTILSMFSKSPFKPLVSHINQVNECVNLITPLFEAYQSKNYGKVEEIAKDISDLEHKADQIKSDIRLISLKTTEKLKRLRKTYQILNTKQTKSKVIFGNIYRKVFFYP